MGQRPASLVGRARFGGLAVEALQVGQQFLRRLAGSAIGRVAAPRHGGLEEEAGRSRVGLPLADRQGHVDHPPCVADLHQGADLHLHVLAAAFGNRHHVLIDPQVLGRAVGSGGHHAGPVGGKLHPRRIGPHHLLPGRHGLEVGHRLGNFGGHALGPRFSQAQRLQLGRGEHQTRETVGVVRGQRGNHLGRHFFGRDRFPIVDHAVLVAVHCPAASAGVKPTILIHFAVEIGIDVAVDLQAVLIIAPLIDDVVVVGVDEFSQDDPLGIFDDPADMAVDLLGRNFALRGLLRAGPVVVHAELDGRQLQAPVLPKACPPTLGVPATRPQLQQPTPPFEKMTASWYVPSYEVPGGDKSHSLSAWRRAEHNPIAKIFPVAATIAATRGPRLLDWASRPLWEITEVFSRPGFSHPEHSEGSRRKSAGDSSLRSE